MYETVSNIKLIDLLSSYHLLSKYRNSITWNTNYKGLYLLWIRKIICQKRKTTVRWATIDFRVNFTYEEKIQTHNMIQGASFVTFCGNSFYMYNNHLIRKLLLRKKSKLLHDSRFNTLSAIWKKKILRYYIINYDNRKHRLIFVQ